MSDQSPPAAIESRVEWFAQEADLGWVSAVLTEQRDAILARWLDAATEQPFHAGHREHAVADHIPHLFDALVAFLERGAPAHVESGAPLEDADVLAMATKHAQVRLDQGLQPIDVVTEFRLLRQEILGCLRRHLPDGVPTGDVLAAELLVNDALDGAISVGLRALTDMIEMVREDFLATTIHDVRQPLTLIKGSAQFVARIAQRPQPDLERIGDEARRIAALVDRMTELLAMLTDATRIALRHLELRTAPLDLADLLAASIEQFGLETATRITLTVAPALDTTGHWDGARLLQVAGNLLANAVKYSPPDTPIAVTLRGGSSWLEFSVRDEGMGIAPEDLPRLFDRYSRAQAAVERGIEGLGLGLYLCRGIVEAHGGRIWASSAGPGRGSTFHVILPRTTPSGRPPSGTAPPADG